ncbi:hypothetical protein [Cryptosporidium parvum Iowa II]|uniref:Uncharacterized protein n=2 Tax=Cryptosporidium parvum TaxID=5807 RepID=Q5CYU3_CRYPI|nr:hypothetical protein [Cryptosporidium parvum Iowa II]EAK90574.1 hypothetical protein cgd7_990 [Cryptosporidium parvum Iowa II]QOY40412.1 Uncharacterized protein CPATCC_0006730 [Cryptosporidium parvum]WKS78780.1 hypothetical protein CPCDC_7g990 [Cryptosporidium sp. 43IA8]WRK33265.1 Uncharacterized protein cpbgf_700990 [Cryptosporidium parvum]|eukprot:QOY40412.1 hypothetical protein CPATCC_003258 [Cryptosporidium parvum]
MSRKEHEDDDRGLEKLLEHLTLQNDAFSSSNKLLMNYYKTLKIQTCNLMSLIKALICITNPNSLSQEDENCALIVNTCKLKWVESLYNFLNITEHDLETIVISPIIESYSLSEAKFELKMSLIKSELNLQKDSLYKNFYSNIIGSLNLIHDSKGIREFVFEALNLFQDKKLENSVTNEEPLFNIFLVKLFNNHNSEEAILITSNQNEGSSQIFCERLNFVDPSKYFCFDKCILFNKFNLRFLVYNSAGGLCWSDRICDMNTQFLQDYFFLFKFDNPKRKLIFNIISSLNQFISNFMINSIDALNIDQYNNALKLNQNCEFQNTNNSLLENKPSEPLSPIETFNTINKVLSSNDSLLSTSIIKPGNTIQSSIINSINTFTSCVSQEIHLDKIDISSNQVTNFSDSSLPIIQRSNSNTTTLSEFIGERNNHTSSSETQNSINIDFFYENDLHSHEWVLL